MGILDKFAKYLEMRDHIRAHPDELFIEEDFAAMHVSSVGGTAVFFGDVKALGEDAIRAKIKADVMRMKAVFN